jgi:hypothetical protein
MKRILIIAAAVSITGMLAIPARAASISAGPVAWFAWWNPVFEDSLRFKDSPVPVMINYRMNPAFMYGPMLTFGTGSWNVSAVFIMGEYHASAKGMMLNGTGNVPMHSSQDIDKYDLDATLSYTINPVIKIFWGLKYQRYTWSRNSTMGYTGFPALIKLDSTSNNYGTGLGISFTFNLSGNLYVLLNISSLYILNDIQNDQTTIMLPSIYYPVDTNTTVHSFGGNATLSLAYYFDTINTTLSVGGRYQYIRYLKSGNTNIDAQIHSLRDQFYGVFVSAIYTFNM